MAAQQKREKEETELKVPESIPLCSPTLPAAPPTPPPQHNIAVISDVKISDRSSESNTTDLKMCKQDQPISMWTPSSSSVKERESLSLCSPAVPAPPAPQQPPTVITDLKICKQDVSKLLTTSVGTTTTATDLVSRKRQREVTRCSHTSCRRRVGLIPFRCRCGDLFCSEHRYSDRHDCNYDYKTAGREAIARENPVVKAAKILKV